MYIYKSDITIILLFCAKCFSEL